MRGRGGPGGPGGSGAAAGADGRAAGKECSLQQLEHVREMQEKLARLHFGLDVCVEQLPEEQKKAAADKNLDRLLAHVSAAPPARPRGHGRDPRRPRHPRRAQDPRCCLSLHLCLPQLEELSSSMYPGPGLGQGQWRVALMAMQWWRR